MLNSCTLVGELGFVRSSGFYSLVETSFMSFLGLVFGNQCQFRLPLLLDLLIFQEKEVRKAYLKEG